jgi:DNA phosphorothioation-dependent restriction protein DptH
MTATKVVDALTSLDSAHFPEVLPGLDPGEGFVFGDTLGFHAVAMVGARDPEPKAAISLMATCLAGDRREIAPEVGRHSVDVLAREAGHYLDCHTRMDADGQAAPPNLLYVHAIKPGDGMIVARALGRALELQPGRAGDESEEEHDLCFVLDLFPSEGQEAIAGRFLLDVAQRRRAGAGAVEQADRWMLDTVQRPGDILVPRLRWARREGGKPSNLAHLAFAFDIFESTLEAVPAGTLPQEPRPLHGYGLVVAMERQVALADQPTWRVFLPLKTEGDKHPANRILTDRITRLYDAVARATAMQLGGDRTYWPVLTTQLPSESEDRIRDLHRTSDWVVTADRNVCIEYFDSPKEARAVYDAYVIDCVPERNDLGCLQLVTSTCNLDEVRNLFDEMLVEMGLSSSARNCEFLLWHLKGLSGRLAIRLASEGTKAGELVALALVHAACASAEASSPVWLPLTEGFFIPLDEISDILPQSDAGPGENRRADLVFVTAGPRRSLEFRFVEVKFRRHLRMARSTDLLEKIVAQAAAVRKRWEEYFFGPVSPVTRALRRSALARLLYFYVDKASRHHLAPEAYERLRREIDKLLLQGDGYVPTAPERPDYGYVFCPELRTVEFERLFLIGHEEANLFLVGISYLPDSGSGAAAPHANLETVAEPDGGNGASEREGASVPGTTVESSAAQAAVGASAVSVLLGSNAATDERVHWRLSIKSNPHLMIIGLPGMGKTTCLVNLCRQLHATRITPIVFSYHQDIDEKLESACGQVNTVDYDGLGFNPLQVASTSPHAHVDVASELRDIFGAIFPDLGDIQTEEIRQAIKQSYLDCGWGVAEDATGARPTPPFQAFSICYRPNQNPTRVLWHGSRNFQITVSSSRAGLCAVYSTRTSRAWCAYTEPPTSCCNGHLHRLCSTASTRICSNVARRRRLHTPLYTTRLIERAGSNSFRRWRRNAESLASRSRSRPRRRGTSIPPYSLRSRAISPCA